MAAPQGSPDATRARDAILQASVNQHPKSHEDEDDEAWLQHQLALIAETEGSGRVPATDNSPAQRFRQWFLFRWFTWCDANLTRLELREVCNQLDLPPASIMDQTCDAYAYALALRFQSEWAEAGCRGMGFMKPDFVDPEVRVVRVGLRTLRVHALRIAPLSYQ